MGFFGCCLGMAVGVCLFYKKKKKGLTSGSDFTSDFAWPTGVITLAFMSGLPCEFPTPGIDLVADMVLVMGLT